MLLLELAHVEADHAVLVAEQQLGEGLGQLRLAHAGRAEEEEGTHGAVRVAHTGPVAAHRLRDGGDRLVLADDPGVHLLLQLEELLLLAGGQLGHRDAGAPGDDVRDVPGGHGHDTGAPLLDPRALALRLGDPPLQPSRALEVLGGDGLVAFPAQFRDAVLTFGDLGRARGAAQPDPGARLVHHVDRLVGQEPVADVPVGQFRRRGQGAVGEADLVVRLVRVAQTFQDLHGLLDRRLRNQYRLEAPFEGRVLLDVLAVLVDGGRAHHVQFSAGESGLEHVPGVHRALARRARADDRVQFVDEEDDLPVRCPDVLDDLLQPLLELPAVLGTRHHAGQVERDDALALQGVGDVSGHDALGQSLDDRGLADARLADEHGVVLGPPRKDLDGLLDLLGPSHDRVEPPGLRLFRQVASELVQGRRRLVRLCGTVVRAARPFRESRQFLRVLTVGAQKLGGAGVGVTEQGAENVLGADVGHSGRLRAGVGGGEGALGRRGEARFRGRFAALPGKHLGELGGEGVGVHLRAGQQRTRGFHLRGGPEQVLGVEIGRPVLQGPLRGQVQQFLRGLRQQPSDGHPLHRWRRRRG